MEHEVVAWRSDSSSSSFNGNHLVEHALWFQNSYFCTSKASKLSTAVFWHVATTLLNMLFGFSIRTFVPVKQVN
jgi:hypothetical protein